MNSFFSNFRWHRTADKWGPRQLAVLEIGAEHTRLVSIQRASDQLVWDKALNLPRIDDDIAKNPAIIPELIGDTLPDAHYVSLVLSGNIGFVRLLNFPGDPGNREALQNQVRQTLGVEDDFLVQHSFIENTQHNDQKKKSEFAVLASALPIELVDSLRKALVGARFVPVSLVPNGAIAANLAGRHMDTTSDNKSQGFLWIGSRSSMLLLYANQQLALARQFKLGIRTIIEALMGAFDLDYDTALKLFDSGSFDFSGNLGQTAASWLHQVGISLDFIERRHGKRIEELHIYGSGTRTQVLQDIFNSAIGRPVVEWAVLNSLGHLQPPGMDDDATPQSFANALCEGVRIMERGLKINA